MPKHKCPTCDVEFVYATVSAYPTFPFCSNRCRLIDLGAWFAEEHQIVEEIADAEDEGVADDSQVDATRESDPWG